jgi:outer membrane receptor protein involved in Fe transport
MHIQEFACFAAGANGGNPALTVEDGPVGAEQRLALARKRGLTCVFIDSSAEPGIAACLDFVYPHTRSPRCLHATLAAAHVLFGQHGAAAPLTVATAVRRQRLVLLMRILLAACRFFRSNSQPARVLLLFGLSALTSQTHAADPDTPIVTVTIKKAEVVHKVDKTVYDVSNMTRAENGTAQDVLQSTPEVSLTADGQIAVKGNKQVTVLIDGKPTAMMSGDEQVAALQTMSGADIASIEVITNPSAAYNANGGAILNIVLKRNRTPGAHGQIQASTTDDGLWNTGASGDATSKNISLHGNLGYRRDGNVKVRQSTVDWINPTSGQAVQTSQASEVFVRRVVATGALGLDYVLSKADSLSLSARYNKRRSRPLFDVLNASRTAGVEIIYHRISLGPNEQVDASASVGYTHQDGGAALKAMLQHSDTRGLVDKSYSDVFVAPVRATDYSHGATQTSRRLNQATLDWSRRSGHGQWGAGVDFQDRTDGIANYQAAINPSTGIETPDPATTNGYSVNTTTNAAYVTDQIREGNWEILLGGRAERTTLRVGSAPGIVPAAHWQVLNPSVNLKYAATGKTDVSFAYRRSLQMPDPRDLDPFTTYIDAQNLSRGNAALRPQHLSSWELGIEADAAPVAVSLTTFYRTSKDTVVDARTIGAGNVLVTSRQNGGRARSAGLTGSADWKVSAAMKLGIDAGVARVLLGTLDIDRLMHQVATTAYVNLRTSYSNGGDDLTLDAHSQSAGIAPLGRYGATSNVNLTWKHQFDKTVSLTVNANDMFDGSRRSYSTNTSTFRQTGFDHFVARRVYVGLVKKFK